MNLELILSLGALVIGTVLGAGLIPWMASPFGGLPLGKTAVARILHTVAQMIRGAGVLIHRADNRYTIGIYNADRESVYLGGDGWFDDINADPNRWALFGKRPFGLTWEPGTDFHERIDAGNGKINMAAAHRMLRHTNEADAIYRTEEAAKAEFGGAESGFGQIAMAVLVLVSLIMGGLTTYVML